MRGEVAEFAEVIDAGDEAATEDVMPHAVDDDPRGERVVLHVRHVLGEFESAALLRGEGLGIERIEKTAGDDFGKLVVIATNKERGVLGIGLDHTRHAQWARAVLASSSR